MNDNQDPKIRFPHAEYIPEVPDFQHELSEEVRRYPTPEQMQICITGLRKIYGNTPLASSLALTGYNLAKSPQLNVNNTDPAGHTRMFCAGGLLSLHAATRYVDSKFIASLVETQEIGLIRTKDFEGKESDENREIIIEILRDISKKSNMQEKFTLTHAAKLYGPEESPTVRAMFNLGAICMQDAIEVASKSEFYLYSRKSFSQD